MVDPVVSIAYRFALAALVLFAWAGLRRERLALTRAQHLAALGVGLFTFCLNYAFVYWAEARVSSALVAVLFAAMAFVNLVGFRIAFGARAPALAWGAAALGVVGVFVLSWDEIGNARMSGPALAGVGLTLAAVVASAAGNIYARRGGTRGIERHGIHRVGDELWRIVLGALRAGERRLGPSTGLCMCSRWRTCRCLAR